MKAHTHLHTQRLAHACTNTHTHTPVAYQGNNTEEKVFKKRKGFQWEFKRADRGRMVDRNKELVPYNWSLVRERVLTTGLCSEGWYSEHFDLCFSFSNPTHTNTFSPLVSLFRHDRAALFGFPWLFFKHIGGSFTVCLPMRTLDGSQFFISMTDCPARFWKWTFRWRRCTWAGRSPCWAQAGSSPPPSLASSRACSWRGLSLPSRKTVLPSPSVTTSR